jgi:hypothetical protein
LQLYFALFPPHIQCNGWGIELPCI